MAETLLGPFAPHWRGDYNPNTVYQFLDIVYLDGSTWLRIEQTESSGVQPGTDANVWARSSTSASTVDRDRAEAAANLAGQHKDDAQTAAGNAQTAQGAAETAQGAAETSASNAANSATLAEAAAAAAQNSACPYGIGDILTTLNPAPPAVRWPGTVWAALGGRMLIGADGTYAAGSTGGEATHKLTEAEIPSHYHTVRGNFMGTGHTGYNSKLLHATDEVGGGSTIPQNTNISGSGGAHNNMPPYLSVYMWKRTA